MWTPPKKEKQEPVTLRRFAGHTRFSQYFNELKVAHLTDQHVGRVTPMSVQKHAVQLVNEQKPDLVVITGDFVCHGQAYLDALEEVISEIDAPVIGVLGNHDHWSGAKEVRHSLKKAGAEVLDNANTIVTLGHVRLQVLGLDDAYTGHADLRKASRGLRSDLPVLGLSHIAEEAEKMWQLGVPLVLSGHTHAGQITLARLHEFALGHLAGHRFVHGLYGSRFDNREKTSGAVYVGAGIGASVMPLRIGDRGRPEVTIFELGLEPGSLDEHHEEQNPLPGRKPSAKALAKRAAKVKRKQRSRDRQAAKVSQPLKNSKKSKKI
ncbi:MAG: metallophosphoesterase [Myxococcales bacterium]|nr:MAG: metallophosphoesterase [Myxococcales bacterium]